MVTVTLHIPSNMVVNDEDLLGLTIDFDGHECKCPVSHECECVTADFGVIRVTGEPADVEHFRRVYFV